MKHVDRDRVFDRLEKILATVKITPSVVNLLRRYKLRPAFSHSYRGDPSAVV